MLVAAVACSESRHAALPLCDADCTPRVHPPGILDPASDDFHAKELARDGWDLNLCASCHGTDFAGGNAAPTCLSCHAQGPTACVTCHGPGALDEPKGNHAPHAALDCGECHVVPASWDAPGHILNTPPPAQVTLGALANLTPTDARARRRGPATWDGATCTNVYCHGDATPYFGGADPEPRWGETPPRFVCDRCHGAPPPDHLRADCVSCHPPQSREHVDGVVEVL
ncbi:MAG: CxxxxCH/CxxCH domain c-type cytochrome [Acidobacteriota bacterium]